MVDSLLSTVTTGRVRSPRRILAYGIDGVGKSTWAASAPSPIFLNLEDGLDNIDCAKFPIPEDFAQVMAQLEVLANGGHKYKVTVIDTVDWLEKLIHRKVIADYNAKADKKDVASLGEIGYGKGYALAMDYWHQVLAALSSLRLRANMTVIMLAHSKIERFEDPAVESYDRYIPKLHRGAGALLQEYSDEVLFAAFKVSVREVEEKFNQKRNLAFGSGERVLYTVERPSFVAKNRASLPDEIPMVWATLAKHYKEMK